MTWKDLFFGFKGRIGRKDYWIGVLLLAVAAAPLGLLGTLGGLLGLLFVFPQVALFIKRLHDLGKPAWTIAYVLVPGSLAQVVAGFADGASDGAAFGASLFVVVASIISIVVSLRTALTKGDPEPNVYGPPQPSYFGRKDAEAGIPG